MTLFRFVIALCLFAGIYGVLPGQATISSISSNSAQLGQTLTVNITGTDLNWMLGCGSALSSTNEAWIDGGGHPDITSNSISISPTLITANFTIPNDVTYAGLNDLNIGAYYYWGQCAFDWEPFVINYGPAGNLVYLQGNIYEDLNSSCLRDGGEQGMGGTIVRLDPGAHYFTTDAQGDFGFWIPGNNYSVSIPNEPLYSGSCPATITLPAVVAGDTFRTDIGMIPDSVSDLRVAISSSIPRPGFSYFAFVNYQNKGLLTNGGTLKVAIDTNIQNLTSLPAWNTFANDTAYYYLPGLSPGTSGHIQLSGTVPLLGTISFGQVFRSTATFVPDNTDFDLSNNYDFAQDQVVGSYDPNDKSVFPTGYGNSGSISPDDSLLLYRIRFQNTGTDTAFSVTILDTLDPDLNWGSLTILGSSHPYQFTLDSGVVEWSFPNILLPDSNTNNPASHGWIRYSIKQKAGLVRGTRIENRAGIYFDFNPAILTNTVRNTICPDFSPGLSSSAPQVCQGDTVLLTTGIPGSEFIWSSGDSSSTLGITVGGTYTVSIVDTFGCQSDPDTLNIPSMPLLNSNFGYYYNSGVFFFSDSSLGNPFQWNWDFGDGNTGSGATTSHSYATADTFNVCLHTQNSCGFDTTCKPVIVTCPTPVAGFTNSNTNYSVNFTNVSTGNPGNFFWDFGDGFSSTQAAPTHIYASLGTYNVCLITQNGCGSDTICKSVSVTCNTLPVANSFSHQQTSYFPPRHQFTANVSGSPSSLLWVFGDGTTSSAANPNHFFPTWGAYNVCLIVSNACGSSSYCDTVYVGCSPPISSFSSTLSGKTASFSNSSSGWYNNSFYWDFGDGTNSSQSTPTHTFPVNGNYTVCLTTTNSCGSHTTCQTVSVNCGDPNASFSYSGSGTSISFTHLQAGAPATGWNWNFGDGTTSTSPNPTHPYPSSGGYNVCLIASNACGSDTSCQNIQVSCTSPTSAFSDSISNRQVFFTNASTSASNWTWDFGDGNGSSSLSPSHTYANNGTYTVCLSSQNSCGSDTTCRAVVINCASPTAAFSHTLTNFTAQFSNSSSGAISYYWDFGDGTIANTQSPAHTFAANGTYTVCLISQNSCGSDTACQTVVVNCTTPAAAFSHTTTNFTVQFSNTSSGANSYYWDFGDGAIANTQSPAHTFAANGTYTVCLISQNSCGSDTACQTVVVNCATPATAFSHTLTNFTVQFSNSSTGAGSYFWEFGDGTASTSMSPTHTYAFNGTYNVCLVSSNVCGSDTLCQTVSINCQSPTASFFAGSSGLSLTLINFSSGNPGTYLWDFGDGNTSSQAAPGHTYANPGAYSICLVAQNGCGSDTTCKIVNISCPGPTSSFSHNASNLSVNFQDLSTGNPGSYLWDFGDGNISNSANTNHTYGSPGTYNVCLITTSNCGSDTACQSITVSCPLPTPTFSHTASQLSVNFVDNSGGNPTGWVWDFGDGYFSNSSSPTHNYLSAGTYQVCLTVQNSCGSQTSCQNLTVNCPEPTAAFSQSISNLNVSFSDQTTGSPASWHWDFGDGVTSASPNPAHTYGNPGTYNVCLVTGNDCGNDTICQLITLTCPVPASAFNYATSNTTFSFTDQSTPNPDTWNWNFGDGYSSTQQNPTHTYATSGTYTACLTSSNDCGSDTSCQTLMVVGMEEEALAGIRLYPNPSAGRVTVEFDGIEVQRLRMEVYSPVGELIREIPEGFLRSGKTELDLSDQAAGIYFLRMTTEQGSLTRRIEIIKN